MKKICGIISAASFLLMLGVVGGMERGSIVICTGFVSSGIFLAVFSVSARLYKLLPDSEEKEACEYVYGLRKRS